MRSEAFVCWTGLLGGLPCPRSARHAPIVDYTQLHSVFVSTYHETAAGTCCEVQRPIVRQFSSALRMVYVFFVSAVYQTKQLEQLLKLEAFLSPIYYIGRP